MTQRFDRFIRAAGVAGGLLAALPRLAAAEPPPRLNPGPAFPTAEGFGARARRADAAATSIASRT
jgi:hypothetical protein